MKRKIRISEEQRLEILEWMNLPDGCSYIEKDGTMNYKYPGFQITAENNPELHSLMQKATDLLFNGNRHEHPHLLNPSA
jgi:hypothetical protein